jgi:hypothetical protein
LLRFFAGFRLAVFFFAAALRAGRFAAFFRAAFFAGFRFAAFFLLTAGFFGAGVGVAGEGASGLAGDGAGGIIGVGAGSIHPESVQLISISCSSAIAPSRDCRGAGPAAGGAGHDARSVRRR